MASVAAIILAAGSSRRHLSGDKLMRQFRGKPLALHAIENAKAARVTSVHFVVRNAETELALLALQRGLTVVEAADAERGMGASLAAGISAIGSVAQGAAIFLADMPCVSEAAIELLFNRFSEEPDRIVRPVYKGSPGHPVIFPASLFADLGKLTDDVGGRDIFRRNPVREVSVDDPGVVFDLDDDAAFERFG